MINTVNHHKVYVYHTNMDTYLILATQQTRYINPLSPRDALKHHFASLKNDLIF